MTMMTKEAKRMVRSCPVCGGEMVSLITYDEGTDYTTYCVCCERCGCHTKRYQGEHLAIQAWNKQKIYW